MLREGAKRLAERSRALRENLSKVIPTNKTKMQNPASQFFALCRPGGYGGVAAPVPIPNTAVKHPSADGTSSQDAGE